MAEVNRDLIKVGVRASVTNKEEEYGPGTIRYIGQPKFQPGEWVGIELDNPTGKNDGSVKGDRYFNAKPNHGVFTRITAVTLWDTYSQPKGATTTAASPPAQPEATPATEPAPAQTPPPSQPRPAEAEPAAPQAANSQTTAPKTSGDGEEVSYDELFMELDAQHQAEKEKWEEERQGLEEDKGQLQLDLLKLQQAFDGIMKLEKDYQSKVASLEGALAESAKSLAAEKDTRAKLEDQVQTLSQLKEAKPAAAVVVSEAPQGNTSAVKELQDQIVKLREEIEDQAAHLELATVDKEVAEEQLDTISKELVAAKSRITELETYKQKTEDQEELKRQAIVSGNVDNASNETVQVLLQQNQKFQEALVALKDYSDQVQAQRDQLASQIQVLHSTTLPQLEEKNTELEVKLLEYEDRMHELKDELDNSKALEDKFQDLFDRKLDLEEENKDLRDKIKDLEELKELADESEEQNDSIVKKLRAELYSRQVESLDLNGAIGNLQKVVQESTVRAEHLEGYISQLRQALVDEKERSSKLVAPSPSAEGSPQEEGTAAAQVPPSEGSSTEIAPVPEGIQQMLQQQALRSAAKAIDEELRALELQQAITNVTLFKLFIPDSAIKTDNECAALLLLMKRLKAKAAILSRALYRQYQLESFERRTSAQADEFVYFIWTLYRLVVRFEYNASGFLDTLKECDEETYLKLGKVIYELLPYEKKLDHLLQLAYKDEITTQFNMEDIKVVLERFDLLVDKLLPKGGIAASRSFGFSIRDVGFHLRDIVYGETKIRDTLRMAQQAAAQLSQQPLSPRTLVVELVSADRSKLLADICRKASKALQERDDDSKQPPLVYVGSVGQELAECATLIKSLAAIVSLTQEKLKSQIAAGEALAESKVIGLVSSLLDTTTPPSTVSAISMLESITAAFIEKQIDTSSLAESPQSQLLDKFLDGVYKLLYVFIDNMEKGVFDHSPAPLTPRSASSAGAESAALASISCKRYEERAKSIRADLEATLEIKRDMEKMKKEVADRDTNLAAKVKLVEDLQWKIKKLEHKISILEKEEKELKETTAAKLQMAVTREKTLEEQNQSFQKLMDTLTASNKELTARLASLDAADLKTKQLLADAQTNSVASASIQQLTGELSGAREALLLLQRENLRLKSKQARERIGTVLQQSNTDQASVRRLVETRSILKNSKLGDSNAAQPDDEAGLSTTILMNAENAIRPSAVTKGQLSTHLARIARLAVLKASLPTVVDLSSNLPPEAHLQSQEFETERITALIEKVAAKSSTQDTPTPSQTTPQPIQQVQRHRVAKLSLSAPSTNLPKHVGISRSQLSRLHDLAFVK